MEGETPASEAELVARAQAGDERAFEALCRQNEALLRARVRPWIAGPVRRRVSLVDVMQDAYIAAHQRLDEFRDHGPGAFGAWLARIAEFKAREAVRRHAGALCRDAVREVTHGARPDTAQARARGRSPSQAVAAREDADAIARALDKLSDDHRTVLRLVQFDHQPLRQAALLMGRTYDATKKLYGRAVTALARELKGLEKEREHGP